MVVNKFMATVVILIAVIIYAILALFYMKVSCTGFYESYIDTSKPVDPILKGDDVPIRYKSGLCIKISTQEFWGKLKTKPELKQKMIDEFREQKSLNYDDLYAADMVFKKFGILGLNRYTLIQWTREAGQ